MLQTAKIGLWSLLALLSAASLGQAQESESRADQKNVEQLIERLGADSYSDRENASARLIAIGPAALPALEVGANHDDREVRHRCRQLLSQIARTDLKHRIDAFLADKVGDNDYGLPFWKEFRGEYGDSETIRNLFVEMQHEEPAFLQAIVREPSHTAELIEARSMQLQNYTQQEGRQAEIGSIVTLLAVAGIRHDEVSDETHPKLFHFCHQPDFQAAISTGPRREILRKMVGTLVRESDNMWSLYYVLDFAMKYDLKEGLPRAIEVLDNRNSQAHIRQLAILAVGKLGDKSHLPLFEKIFDDATRTGSHSLNDRVFHQQIRDLALAVAAHVRGYDLLDIGFEQVEAHPYMLFHPSTIGFENDIARQKAFDNYARKVGAQAAVE